ncbi:MAG: DNA-processing protein DprA [Vicinamibacterales bacterium]
MDLQTAVAASMLPTSRGTVSAAFKQLRHDNGAGPAFLEFLWAASGRADPLAAGVLGRILESAARAIVEAPRLDIQPVPVFDPAYPALLGCTVDPPPVLWVRGRLEVFTRRAVAVVGSRAASPYALQVGARIAAELAERGILVASGLARGVDSAAHRGCLKAGGPTVAVLGSGVDRVYPPEHADLAKEIAKTGLVLAELAPGAAPLPEHFPLRNRIISGISLATVVVEASEQSGSLITARCALEQGRDVMAVPGSVLSGRNRGSHALLKDGARVVETADDILQELGWNSAVQSSAQSKSLISEPLLVHMEPGELYGLDELAASTGIEGARLLARLTDLELAGWITAAGGRFVRRS